MIERGSVKYRRALRFPWSRARPTFWEVYGPLGAIIPEERRTAFLSAYFDRKVEHEFDGETLTWEPTIINLEPKEPFQDVFERFVKKEFE